MLSSIYIENVAVIEKLSIDFEQGFNVITGETGAGKSVIIDSINAILGHRVSKDMIRTGADSALILATFNNVNNACAKALSGVGIEIFDDSLILQRKITISGNNSCKINDRPVTLSTLKSISTSLVAINGQNQSFELLNPEMHMAYLDNMGDYKDTLNEYQINYSKLGAIRSEIEKLNIDENEKSKKIDLLRYQINEIKNADLNSGEFEELTERKNVILNSEKISKAIFEANSMLSGEDSDFGIIESLGTVSGLLRNVPVDFEEIESISSRIENALYELDDCLEELRDISSEVEFNENELNEIESRLDVIYRLYNKYGSSTEEVLKFLQNSKEELKSIELSDEKREKLISEYKDCLTISKDLAIKISKKRKSLAIKFSNFVTSELVFLDMPKVVFEISQNICKLNKFGCDSIEFLISVNPGEPPKPISKIASGGELSRIMLAIKSVFAKNDAVDTLIFDEIDTGISGSTSQKVGLKLKDVSKSRQVMCVTHSAQIASLANTHFLISKTVDKDRTYTMISKLNYEGRRNELARIIGGVKITELTLKNAEEMLKLSK